MILNNDIDQMNWVKPTESFNNSDKVGWTRPPQAFGVLSYCRKQKRLLGRNDLDGTINGTIKLSKTATIIYKLMKKDVKVTKSQLSQSSGKSIRTVSRAIDELKNNGLLLGRTSNKNGEWILKK